MTRHDGVFPGRMDAFPRLAVLAEQAAAAAGFPRDDMLRLRLVIEELFTNTVMHGHGAASEAPIRLTLESHAGRVAVTYEDTGPPFDPTTVAASEPPGRSPGGLGLVLVKQLGRELTYTRLPDHNRLTLVIERAGPR